MIERYVIDSSIYYGYLGLSGTCKDIRACVNFLSELISKIEARKFLVIYDDIVHVKRELLQLYRIARNTPLSLLFLLLFYNTKLKVVGKHSVRMRSFINKKFKFRIVIDKVSTSRIERIIKLSVKYNINVDEVDARLIELARTCKATLVSCDENMKKLASLLGVHIHDIS